MGKSENTWEPQGMPLKSNVEIQFASNGNLWTSNGNRKGTQWGSNGKYHGNPMDIQLGKPKEIQWASQGDPMAIP